MAKVRCARGCGAWLQSSSSMTCRHLPAMIDEESAGDDRRGIDEASAVAAPPTPCGYAQPPCLRGGAILVHTGSSMWVQRQRGLMWSPLCHCTTARRSPHRQGIRFRSLASEAVLSQEGPDSHCACSPCMQPMHAAHACKLASWQE